jgi:nucleoside-diphosphate-sugar epimerase
MSPGEQLLDILYIDDVVDAFKKLILQITTDSARLYAGKSFSANSCEVYSLRELAEIFENISGKRLNINWGAVPYRTREVMKPWNAGEKVIGWKQKVLLPEGIKSIIY